MRAARFKWSFVGAMRGLFFKATILVTTGNEGSVVVVEFKKSLYESGLNLIIAIDEAEIIASGLGNTNVSSSGLTRILLMNSFDARIFFGVFVDDFTGIIGRAVIDENDFKIMMSLVNNGVEAFW